MISADTVLIVAWAMSALMVGLNAWELCRRQPPTRTEAAEPLWYEVGFYLTPHYAETNARKLAPLYYNTDPTAAQRWAYPDLSGRLVYPSETGVRRRGVTYAGTPLIK